MIWVMLAMVALLTIGIGLAVCYATHPVPFFGSRRIMFVSSGKGWQVHQIPSPDRYLLNGMQHIPDYARKLVQTKSPTASLIISGRGGKAACLVIRIDGHLLVMENIEIAPPARAQAEHEAAVRKLFKDLGIEPGSDIVHDYNGVKDAMRDLKYPLPDDEKRVSLVITRLLAEVDKVTTTEGLEFTFSEK